MASDIASSHRVWPLRGGQTGALIRDRDWSATSLGNSARWPERFRAAVDTCLNAPFASFAWWGPELIQLIVQSRHPAVFGLPAREAWPDVWPTVSQIVEGVMNTSRPAPGASLTLTRTAELAAIRFSCRALREAAGVLLTAFDKTKTVCGPPPRRDRVLCDAIDGTSSSAFDPISSAAIADAFKGNNLTRWLDLIGQEDRVQEERTAAAAVAARPRGFVTREHPARRPADGKVCSEPNADFALTADACHLSRVNSFRRHLTGDAVAADGVAAMAADLQHHTRDLIAVVRAIISNTLATSPCPEEFWRRIDDRLRALSRVQGLLSRSRQEPIRIGALVRLEFEGSDGAGDGPRGERVDIAGSAVQLRSSVVPALALALHELATNARKYGALSTSGGELRIGWRLEERDQASWLVLNWAEKHRRLTGAPLDRKGDGRAFIEHALSYSHGAQIRFELDEMGLRCSIALRLSTDGNEERRT
jgi:two-component sensor histidine kinase